MSVTLLVVGCVAAFVLTQMAIARGDARALRRWRLGFWVLLGATNLSKGPGFGAVMALVPCIGWCVAQGNWRGLAKQWSFLGAALCLGLAFAWPALVFARGDWPKMMAWWSFEMLGRLDGSYFRTTDPPWYYVASLSWQLLPWTPVVLLGLVLAARRWIAERQAALGLGLCWAVLPAALLSLPPHKHHHYLLSSLPGFAMLGAIGGQAVLDALDRHFGALRASAWLRGVAVAAAVLVFVGARLPGIASEEPFTADRDFLRRVDAALPRDAVPIVARDLQVARVIFYLDRPIALGAEPARLQAMSPADTLYVLTFEGWEPHIAAVASVERLLDSGPLPRYGRGPAPMVLLRVRGR